MVFFDLSKATKLKQLKFRKKNRSSVQWITMTLQTVESRKLQSITICPQGPGPETVVEEAYQEWQDLDHLLVQFWTSHSIRPRVRYVAGREGKDLRGDAPRLLPELTRRGLVDLVETPLYHFDGYGGFFSQRLISRFDHVCVWAVEGTWDVQPRRSRGNSPQRHTHDVLKLCRNVFPFIVRAPGRGEQ